MKTKVKCNAAVLRYHGLHREESKADEEFGSVKGRSWTAASFGKIKAGIPLLRTKGDIGSEFNIPNKPFFPLFQNESWGPFLERPGNLTGPKSYFEIKVSRKVGRVLASNEVYFVSLADNFT